MSCCFCHTETQYVHGLVTSDWKTKFTWIQYLLQLVFALASFTVIAYYCVMGVPIIGVAIKTTNLFFLLFFKYQGCSICTYMACANFLCKVYNLIPRVCVFTFSLFYCCTKCTHSPFRHSQWCILLYIQFLKYLVNLSLH